MATREDLDVDDDFSELYKAYTGPLGSSASNAQDKTTTTNKRSHAGSDGEEEAHDPNAVPTDFTSREAKVWEAKSKATERNWKKRKEEEMICKICGESGHFTQGCPATLGANRKSQDFFERVPAREPHVKALFSTDVVKKIEKDIGCKIKIEERFIIVSGRDRLILKKGVDAVHKVKQEGENKDVRKFSDEGDHKGSSGSPLSQCRSHERRSPVTSRLGRSDSQKSNPSPHSNAHNARRCSRQDKVVEDRVREDLQRLSSGSPRAYGSDEGRGQSSQSKSPARGPYMGNSYNLYGHSQNRGGLRTDGWKADRGGSNLQLERNFDYHSVPQTLEDIELQYNGEATELARIRDKEEDEENLKHREVVREIRENYIKKVSILKVTHAEMWEEFLCQECRRRQRAHTNISASGFGGYEEAGYLELNNSGTLQHPGMNTYLRGGYSNATDSYPSRPHDNYDDFQRHRHDDYARPYNHQY